MDDRVLVAVDIPFAGDERHKNWAKVVESVDTSRSTGWAYDGPFINPGGIQDVPVGSVVLVYGERGSRANPQVEAKVYTVNAGRVAVWNQPTEVREMRKDGRWTVDELAARIDEVGAEEMPILQRLKEMEAAAKSGDKPNQ